MRRPSQLVPMGALLAALLAAAGSTALVDEVVNTQLKDVCTRTQFNTSHNMTYNINCTCSPQHPEMDVLSNDAGFLMDARMITIKNCSVVKLLGDTLRKTFGLQRMSVHNVSRLELGATLPVTLKELVLSGISELELIPESLFQATKHMERLILQDATFKKLESLFPSEISLNFTEIRGCMFPNLSSNSLHIKSQEVVVKGNNFSSLAADALRLQSENADVSDNSFAALANGSIQWQQWPQRIQSKLSFRRNTIRSLETGALSALRASEESTKISDNVLLCPGGNFTRCKRLAESEGLRVCDVKDVCRHRKRNAVTEAMAKARRCDAAGPLSGDVCEVLVVSGSAPLQTLSVSSVVAAAAVALLVTTWSTD